MSIKPNERVNFALVRVRDGDDDTSTNTRLVHALLHSIELDGATVSFPIPDAPGHWTVPELVAWNAIVSLTEKRNK